MRLTLIATAAALIALPALAGTAPAPATAAKPAAVAVQPVGAPAPPAPRKATPEERAEAERMDPLAQAAFWAREADADPKDFDARLRLARALRAMGRNEEAVAAADQVLLVQPTNLDALMEAARGRIAANQGFYAIDDAQRAEAVAPRDWRPVSLLAIAMEQSQRDDEALAAHQKALSLAPDNPATLTNLGLYYATHGDPAQAEPLLRKAAAAPGAGAAERQNLALVLGLEGRMDEAERLQRQDLPPEQVSNNLAYLRADAGVPGERSWQSVGAAQ